MEVRNGCQLKGKGAHGGSPDFIIFLSASVCFLNTHVWPRTARKLFAARSFFLYLIGNEKATVAVFYEVSFQFHNVVAACRPFLGKIQIRVPPLRCGKPWSVTFFRLCFVLIFGGRLSLPTDGLRGLVVTRNIVRNSCFI